MPRTLSIGKFLIFMIALTIALGLGIIFMGFFWGTAFMIVDIVVVIVILKTTLNSPGNIRREKVSIFIGTLISTAVVIILYVIFQIYWYFG